MVRGRTKTVMETHKSSPSTKSSTEISNEAPVSINPKCFDDPCSQMMAAQQSQCLLSNLLWRVRPTSRHLPSHRCTEVRPTSRQWSSQTQFSVSPCAKAMAALLRWTLWYRVLQHSVDINLVAKTLVILLSQALWFEEFQICAQECSLECGYHSCAGVRPSGWRLPSVLS